MIQFNKNTFGLAAAGPLQVCYLHIWLLFQYLCQPILIDYPFVQVPQLQPGMSARTHLPMVTFQNMSQSPPSSLLQVAVKNNQQPVWYFNDKFSLHVFFTEDGRMERSSFLEVYLSPICLIL